MLRALIVLMSQSPRSAHEKRRDEVVWNLCKQWQKTQHKGIPIALMDVLAEAYEIGFRDGEVQILLPG